MKIDVLKEGQPVCPICKKDEEDLASVCFYGQPAECYRHSQGHKSGKLSVKFLVV